MTWSATVACDGDRAVEIAGSVVLEVGIPPP
jgi:hypothetical protein